MISKADILRANILIVDDKASNVALLEQMLRGAGYASITSTTESTEAGPLHRQHRYDLILLDLQMPRMDGFQVMEALKEIEKGGYPPVLVITAQSDHKSRALQVGARDFLSKPLDLKETLARVNNLIEVRLLHREGETRREQAEVNERSLRASELSYRRLFEAARDGILILEVETGRITDVNPFLEELLGFSHAEMIGKTVGELSPFKDFVSNQAMLERLQQDGYVRYEDLPLETRDGRKIDVEFVCNVYQAGDLQVIQCNVRDITERKHAEKARQASETRYRTLFDYAPDGIVIADPQSRYLDANPSLCRMLGYTREELVGLGAADIVEPAELPHIGEALTTIKARSDYHREWQFRRKDGSIFPAEVIATQMPDGNLLGVIRDITERRQIEQALRASEEHFRFLNDLVEATRPLADPAQIMAVSARLLGVHLAVSRCAYADVEADGEKFTILHDYTDGCASTVGRYDLSLFGARAVATLHGGQTLIIRNVREELRPDEGADMFNALGIQAIITCPLVKDGVLRALMAVHSTAPRDWRPAEIALVHDVVERCWATIGRRTAEATSRHSEEQRRLLEGQLAQAQKMEAIGQLAGGLAHDFNNVLTVVIGYSRLLLDRGALPPDAVKAATHIFTAGTRAANLTRQLMVFSRQQAVLRRTVDLNHVADEIGEMLRRLIGDHIRLVLALSRAPCPVEADAGMLEQVLMNLAVNARDAMPGGGTLTIATELCTIVDASTRGHPAARPGEFACLTMRDTGTGIPPEIVHRIFEPFFTTKAIGKGTGLGLAMVFGIVQQHQGWIELESVVGAGTCFRILLPAVAPLPATAESSPDKVAASAPGSETILLVEDEPTVREYAVAVLKSHHYRVLQAASGVEALEVWKWHAPRIGLLLTDLVMPDGLGGVELAGRLRLERPALKVLLTSGYANETIGAEFRPPAGMHFIPKPYNPQQLAQTVRDALDDNYGGGSARPFHSGSPPA